MGKDDPIEPLRQLIISLNRKENLLVRKQLIIFSGTRENLSLKLFLILYKEVND